MFCTLLVLQTIINLCCNIAFIISYAKEIKQVNKYISCINQKIIVKHRAKYITQNVYLIFVSLFHSLHFVYIRNYAFTTYLSVHFTVIIINAVNYNKSAMSNIILHKYMYVRYDYFSCTYSQ